MKPIRIGVLCAACIDELVIVKRTRATSHRHVARNAAEVRKVRDAGCRPECPGYGRVPPSASPRHPAPPRVLDTDLCRYRDYAEGRDLALSAA